MAVFYALGALTGCDGGGRPWRLRKLLKEMVVFLDFAIKKLNGTE